MKAERKRYIIDASAYMTLLKNESGANTVQELLLQADEVQLHMYMSVLHYGEILYKAEALLGTEHRRLAEQTLALLPIQMIPVSLSHARSAAVLKSRGGVGYVDCYAVALAMEKRAIVLTKDSDFKAFENDVEIEWIGDGS
jgi:uncharacterized protein with PIN domain